LFSDVIEQIFPDILEQGSRNSFVLGPHELLRNNSRAGHLTQCDDFQIQYVKFYQINKFFVNILFFHD